MTRPPATTPDTPAITVLIVDAHEMVREGIRTMLERTPRIKSIGETASIAGAMEAIGRKAPDVVLLELSLPDGSGIDACRQIRASSPGTHVLVLTAMTDDASVMAIMRAGAAGVLLKTASGPDLARAIEAVGSGHAIFDGMVLHRMVSHLCGMSFSAHHDATGGLTTQERRVMALVVQGNTNKEIARALGLSDKTIKNYLSNVYTKLQVTRRSHAASAFLQRTRGAGNPNLADLHCPLLASSSA